MALNWTELLWARECPVCLKKLSKPDHGLRRAFCPNCHASIPDALGSHLDRATKSRWFVAWWRVAITLLRRNQETQEAKAISHNSISRKPVSSALPESVRRTAAGRTNP